MAYDHLDTNQLIKEVEERKKFLKKVVNFAEKLVSERGELISRTQGSSNTHTTRKLVGFAKLSFLADWGQTMFGGNEIKIWYHPHFEDINMDGTDPVLHVYYQSAGFNVDDCEVKYFDEENGWQATIEHVIRNKKRVLSQMNKARKALKSGRGVIEIQQYKARQKRINLEKDAKRLGIE